MRERLTDKEIVEILSSPSLNPSADFQDDLRNQLRQQVARTDYAPPESPRMQVWSPVLTLGAVGALFALVAIGVLLLYSTWRSSITATVEVETGHSETSAPPTLISPVLVEFGQLHVDAICGPAETLDEPDPQNTEEVDSIPAFWTARAITPKSANDIELLATLMGARWVNSLSFSPDSSFLIVGDASSAIHVWDVLAASKDATATLSLTGDVMFLPGGESFATADCAGISLWDINTFEQTGTSLTSTTHYHDIDVSSETGWIAANSSAASRHRDTVRVWDPQSDNLLLGIDTESTALAVAISPDGEWLATGHFDGTLSLWQIAGETEVRKIEAHEGPITNLTFSPDGSYLASSGGDGSLAIWDGRIENLIHRPEGHHEWIEGLVWSPDGLTVASSSRDGNVHLWSAETGELVYQIALPVRWDTGTPSATSIAFSPDGRVLAVGSSLGAVRLYGIPEVYQLR